MKEDREWAMKNHVHLHPSVTVNNMTHTNSTGHDLAMSICSAYREAPDECELSWKLKSFMENAEFEGLNTPLDGDQLFKQSQVSHSKNEAE